MVRNIKCGYSFSSLEQAEHVETKIEQIGDISCFPKKKKKKKKKRIIYSYSIYKERC